MYMCEALNAAGRDQKLVQLSVLGMSCLPPYLHCPPFLQSALSLSPMSLRQHSQERHSQPWGCLDALCPPAVMASGQCGVKTLVCRIGQTWV